jgi:hypothetical protein
LDQGKIEEYDKQFEEVKKNVDDDLKAYTRVLHSFEEKINELIKRLVKNFRLE